MSFSAFDVSKTIAAQFTGCRDSRLPDTPLHSAAYEGDIDRLQKFLSNGKRSRDAVDQRNHLGCTPLRLAATGDFIYSRIRFTGRRFVGLLL